MWGKDAACNAGRAGRAWGIACMQRGQQCRMLPSAGHPAAGNSSCSRACSDCTPQQCHSSSATAAARTATWPPHRPAAPPPAARHPAHHRCRKGKELQLVHICSGKLISVALPPAGSSIRRGSLLLAHLTSAAMHASTHQAYASTLQAVLLTPAPPAGPPRAGPARGPPPAAPPHPRCWRPPRSCKRGTQ